MQVNFFVLLDEMEKQYSNDSSNFGTEINNKELIQLLYNNCKIKCFFFFFQLIISNKSEMAEGFSVSRQQLLS